MNTIYTSVCHGLNMRSCGHHRPKSRYIKTINVHCTILGFSSLWDALLWIKGIFFIILWIKVWGGWISWQTSSSIGPPLGLQKYFLEWCNSLKDDGKRMLLKSQNSIWSKEPKSSGSVVCFRDRDNPAASWKWRPAEDAQLYPPIV